MIFIAKVFIYLFAMAVFMIFFIRLYAVMLLNDTTMCMKVGIGHNMNIFFEAKFQENKSNFSHTFGVK